MHCKGRPLCEIGQSRVRVPMVAWETPGDLGAVRGEDGSSGRTETSPVELLPTDYRNYPVLIGKESNIVMH